MENSTTNAADQIELTIKNMSAAGNTFVDRQFEVFYDKADGNRAQVSGVTVEGGIASPLAVGATAVIRFDKPSDVSSSNSYNAVYNGTTEVISVGSEPIVAEVRFSDCGASSSGRQNLRQVTISMGDNGLLLDDTFEVVLNGCTLLHTNGTPTVDISRTVFLEPGSTHQVQMIGRGAPDNVGTYFISFSGASVTGDPLTGNDLVPGIIKNYTIQVPQ